MPSHKTSFSYNRSIKSQVIIFLIAGVSIMTVMIGLVTANAVNDQSRQIMINNAKQITQGLAKKSIFPLLSGSAQNAKDAMDQVLGFQSVASAYLLTNDRAVFNEVTKLKNKRPHLFTANITLPHDINETILFKETDNYWSFISPIKINEDIDDLEYSEEREFELESFELTEKNIGYVEVLYSKKYLIQAQKNITFIITCVAIISVFILCIVLHFGLVRLFTPLQKLASTMQEAQNSKDHLFTEISGAKEIREISNSYNQLMEVLDKQDESLKQNRDILEKEVEIRTKELVTARDAALTSNRHKSEFIANMSHELRTPIQSIIGYAELVLEELEVEGNFDLIDDMDKITNNSQRLLNLINSLLDLAKVESGKMDVNYSEFTTDKLIKTIQDTIYPLSQKNNNNFIITNNTENNILFTDHEKLEQILLNLLSNACKFTENGNIELCINSNSTGCEFIVKDSGIGLTQEQQNYIFEEFKQVDSSHTRLFSGTGLGLAISKRFIELMGGYISVESLLGEGSSFTVKIPLKPKI